MVVESRNTSLGSVKKYLTEKRDSGEGVLHDSFNSALEFIKSRSGSFTVFLVESKTEDKLISKEYEKKIPKWNNFF